MEDRKISATSQSGGLDSPAAVTASWNHAEGAAVYEQSFGYRYIHYFHFMKAREADPQSAERQMLRDPHLHVLMPDALYDRFDPAALFAGKRVLLVGNGRQEARRTARLAGFDHVIRINALYGLTGLTSFAYQQALRHTTIWAGLPKPNVAQSLPSPAGSRPRRAAVARTPFLDLLPRLRLLWITSPYEISAIWLDLALSQRSLEDLVFTPSFRRLDSLFASPEEAGIRQALAAPRHLADGRGGWPAFDVLLTGTRLAVLVASGQPSLLRLEGFDFYSSGQGRLWEGHDPWLDRAALGTAAAMIARQGGQFELAGASPLAASPLA